MVAVSSAVTKSRLGLLIATTGRGTAGPTLQSRLAKTVPHAPNASLAADFWTVAHHTDSETVQIALDFDSPYLLPSCLLSVRK
jgi:hypothetical protein